MTRTQVLDLMRIAGYHGDQKTFTRLYVENRVKLTDANRAYIAGVDQKKTGMKCSCPQCN